ncbi:MAG TPA: DUF3734 domain-containing protein [Acetobacteraceae bacterium]|nr:DUF3734 domain-containing protein [Acetobacteraceae bacterium]
MINDSVETNPTTGLFSTLAFPGTPSSPGRERLHFDLIHLQSRANIESDPALPAVKIEGEYHRDGGIVSKTPLQYLLEREESPSTLVFQVDPFSAGGALSRDMRDVMERHRTSCLRAAPGKIRVSSGGSTVCTIVLGGRAKIPAKKWSAEEAQFLHELSDMAMVNVLDLIDRQKSYEGHAKDCAFSNSLSGTSVRERWEAGDPGTRRMPRHHDWLPSPTTKDGVIVHGLPRGRRFLPVPRQER